MQVKDSSNSTFSYLPAGLALPPGSPITALSGPRDYSATDVAAALTTITGSPVAAQRAPLEAVVPTFTSLGISAQVAELFREMYEGIAAGRVAPEGGAARAVRGSVPVEDTLRSLLGR